MNRERPNPYAPPATESFLKQPKASLETLQTNGPIPFSGTPEARHRDEFLHAEGHVGCAYLLLLGFCVGLFLLVLALQGSGPAAIAIGGIGLFFVAAVVSTHQYRCLVFENANPDWRQPLQGELSFNGVQLVRSNTRAFFRWDWYWSAVAGDDCVAFVPATQSIRPLFITRSMLSRLDDWPRLVAVASAIATHADDARESQHRQRNIDVMREKARQRSMEVPTNAIAFSGMIRTGDLDRLPKPHRRREKPIRSYFVVGALILSGAFIVAGASSLLVQRFMLLPAFIIAYIVLGSIGIAIRKRRRESLASGNVYFSNSYATASSIVSDFAITRTEIEWSALQLITRTDDFVALSRRRRPQLILARCDMFGGVDDWRRFNELVDQKISSATSPDR